MNRSQSSGSSSNANSDGTSLTMGEVKCQCGKPSMVKKAWTYDNPGRRFYGCGNWRSCNFFRWVDVEKPHGWQKTALIEARDLIRQQFEELKKLKALVSQDSNESEEGKDTSEIEKSEKWLEMQNENKRLKQEIAASIEKEKVVRQFVIISWVGFVAVTAIIVHALK